MLVEETIKPFEKQAQEKGLEFKKDIDTFDFALIGDGNRIAQIIKHILENSIAFTEQGFIMVSLKKVIVEKNKGISWTLISNLSFFSTRVDES